MEMEASILKSSQCQFHININININISINISQLQTLNSKLETHISEFCLSRTVADNRKQTTDNSLQLTENKNFLRKRERSRKREREREKIVM